MSAITKETLAGEIVKNYPAAIEVLMSKGMHCLGCPASQAETILDACMVHGLNADEVVEAVNAKIEREKV